MANAKEIVQDPKRAEAIERLQKCFERQYDLTKTGDQQALVEGLAEIGKATALTGSSANLNITFGTNGITGITVTSTPTPVG